MPQKDSKLRAWQNKRDHMKLFLRAGGTLLPSKQRRKLTEDELNVRKVGDRTLSDEEVSAGRLLIKTPLTEEARADYERQLASMEEVDKLHGQERVEAMGEFISDQVDRGGSGAGGEPQGVHGHAEQSELQS